MVKGLEGKVEKEKVLLIFHGNWKYGAFQTSLGKVPIEKKEKYEFFCYVKEEKNILNLNDEEIIKNNINKIKINKYSRIIISPFVSKDKDLLEKINNKNYKGKIFLYYTHLMSQKYKKLDSSIPSKLLDNFD